MAHRLKNHPILNCDISASVNFTFNGQNMKARRNEVISSALFANGVHVLGRHHLDGSPQGIFCANGQCAQCLVIADRVPVKACVTPVKEGMDIRSLEALPGLPIDDTWTESSEIPCVETDVLIVGGGPAGLSAAIELGSQKVKTIVADDKTELGGKLSLQTHNFFGSADECYAGMRGFEIGGLLAEEIRKLDSVSVWLNSPVVGVFCDRKIGVVKDGKYHLVKPKHLLVTAGAREKALAFPGCDLPGVYGAGAFQTLVNRDRVKCSDKILIIGGGNVGLIVAYQALQAGIDVAAVVEALPFCGGYKVHLDKIRRLGVPVYTSHTVLGVEGKEHVERATITAIDSNFKPIPRSEQVFDVDTVLVAVGLSPVNELAVKAREYGISTYCAGDTEEIAEASAAMFTGRIAGRRLLREMGFVIEIPSEWMEMSKILKSKPGRTHPIETANLKTDTIAPVIRCIQEIPCDPCTEICNAGSIKLRESNIMSLPYFEGKCSGCGRCVAVCPGLAISLVDSRVNDKTKAKVIVPWEMPEGTIRKESLVTTTGFEGEVVGSGKVTAIRDSPLNNRRKLVHIEVPREQAAQVAGIRIREPYPGKNTVEETSIGDGNPVVCRCERVTKKEIVDYIRRTDCRDINALKAALKVGLGPCGGKTCTELILRIFGELGVDPKTVTPPTNRPFTQEVPLSSFLGKRRN